jgi:hypothetical protein
MGFPVIDPTTIKDYAEPFDNMHGGEYIVMGGAWSPNYKKCGDIPLEEPPPTATDTSTGTLRTENKHGAEMWCQEPGVGPEQIGNFRVRCRDWCEGAGYPAEEAVGPCCTPVAAYRLDKPTEYTTSTSSDMDVIIGVIGNSYTHAEIPCTRCFNFGDNLVRYESPYGQVRSPWVNPTTKQTLKKGDWQNSGSLLEASGSKLYGAKEKMIWSGGNDDWGPNIAAPSKYCPQYQPRRCEKPYSELEHLNQFRTPYVRWDSQNTFWPEDKKEPMWYVPDCRSNSDWAQSKCVKWKSSIGSYGSYAAFDEWGAAKYMVKTGSSKNLKAFEDAKNGVGYEKLTKCKPAGTCCILLFGDAHDKCGRCCHGHQFEWVWNCGGSRKCA